MSNLKKMCWLQSNKKLKEKKKKDVYKFYNQPDFLSICFDIIKNEKLLTIIVIYFETKCCNRILVPPKLFIYIIGCKTFEKSRERQLTEEEQQNQREDVNDE